MPFTTNIFLTVTTYRILRKDEELFWWNGAFECWPRCALQICSSLFFKQKTSICFQMHYALVVRLHKPKEWFDFIILIFLEVRPGSVCDAKAYSFNTVPKPQQSLREGLLELSGYRAVQLEKVCVAFKLTKLLFCFCICLLAKLRSVLQFLYVMSTGTFVCFRPLCQWCLPLWPSVTQNHKCEVSDRVIWICCTGWRAQMSFLLLPSKLTALIDEKFIFKVTILGYGYHGSWGSRFWTTGYCTILVIAKSVKCSPVLFLL